MQNKSKKAPVRQTVGLVSFLTQVVLLVVLWNTPGVRLVDFSSGLATDILFSHILIIWLALSLLNKVGMTLNLKSRFSSAAVILFVAMSIIATIIPHGDPTVPSSAWSTYIIAVIFLLGSLIVDALELLRSLIYRNK